MRISAGHQHGFEALDQLVGVGFPLIIATTACGQILEERVIHREVRTFADTRPDAQDALISIQRLTGEGRLELDLVVAALRKIHFGLKVIAIGEYDRNILGCPRMFDRSLQMYFAFCITPNNANLGVGFLTGAVSLAIPPHGQESATLNLAGHVPNGISPELREGARNIAFHARPSPERIGGHAQGLAFAIRLQNNNGYDLRADRSIHQAQCTTAAFSYFIHRIEHGSRHAFQDRRRGGRQSMPRPFRWDHDGKLPCADSAGVVALLPGDQWRKGRFVVAAFIKGLGTSQQNQIAAPLNVLSQRDERRRADKVRRERPQDNAGVQI